MISKNYKQNKAEVLTLYSDYVKYCQTANIEIKENIVNQATKIKNEEFNLLILGEAKSGKSTFINAYLGKEVVPMDVRQCTSAIIKIKKGNKFELIAKTAGGGKTIVTGDNDIRKFLKIHASISDKYRSIPISTINNEILLKYHGKKVPNHIMTSFLESELKDNIYGVNNDEYKGLIVQYIKDNSNDWDKIITEMEITYPLPEEMQGITIIDSPGVGAGGNVGKITEDYIDDANAIIFVKSLQGQSLESNSFLSFFRNNCSGKKKEMLFLLFTGKTGLQGSEFLRLKEQAMEMYRNDIKEEKIIFIDSKMQLFLNRCRELGTDDRINNYFDALDEENDNFIPANHCWMKSKNNISLYEEMMEEKSNFKSVQNALEKFARVANYLQLIELLENLEGEYARYNEIFSDTYKMLKKNCEDPIELSDQIQLKKNEINDVYTKINKGIMDVHRKYTDNISGEGAIMAKAKEIEKVYEEKLENFRKLPENMIDENTFSSMKILTLDTIDYTKNFRREIANQVINECNKKLIEYTNDPSKISAEAYKPNFTETDFDDINSSAKEQTSGYDYVESGFTFTKTERTPYHHKKEHVKLIANSIHERLNNEIIPIMIDNVVDFVSACCKTYSEKLTVHKKELELEYQRLLEVKNDSDKLHQQALELENKLEIVVLGIKEVSELKGELKNYVTE